MRPPKWHKSRRRADASGRWSARPEERQVESSERERPPRKPMNFRGRQEKKESKLSLDRTRDRDRMMNSDEKAMYV